MKTCERCGSTEESVGFSITPKLVANRLLMFEGTFCLLCRQKVACCPVCVDGSLLTLLIEEADLSKLAVSGE